MNEIDELICYQPGLSCGACSLTMYCPLFLAICANMFAPEIAEYYIGTGS